MYLTLKIVAYEHKSMLVFFVQVLFFGCSILLPPIINVDFRMTVNDSALRRTTQIDTT